MHGQAGATGAATTSERTVWRRREGCQTKPRPCPASWIVAGRHTLTCTCAHGSTGVCARLLGWLVRYVYEKRGRYSFPRGATLRCSNSSLALRPRWSAALRSSSSGSMVRQAAAAHPIVEVVVGQGGGRGNLLEAEPPEEAGAVLLNVKLQLQASNNATQERKQATTQQSKKRSKQDERTTIEPQNTKCKYAIGFRDGYGLWVDATRRSGGYAAS